VGIKPKPETAGRGFTNPALSISSPPIRYASGHHASKSDYTADLPNRAARCPFMVAGYLYAKMATWPQARLFCGFAVIQQTQMRCT